jgi:hypothetical protein
MSVVEDVQNKNHVPFSGLLLLLAGRRKKIIATIKPMMIKPPTIAIKTIAHDGNETLETI